MPLFKVTFAQNCTVVLRNVIADDEEHAVEKAQDTLLHEASRSSFDIWPGYGEAESE